MFDDIVKHRVEIEKLKNSIASKVIKVFAESYPTMKSFLLDVGQNNQESVINQVMGILDSRLNVIQTDLSSNAIDILQYESQFQAELLRKFSISSSFTASLVNPELAKTLVFNSFMVGDLYQDAYAKMSSSLQNDLAVKIRMAVLEGKTGNDVSRQVREKMITFSDNQLDSLTRTLIQNATNLGTEETYKTSDIEYIQYCAILDSRTTPLCRGLNGNVYPVGDGPRPPMHYNCRSFTIPVDSPKGLKTDATYNDFFNRQEDKTGLNSIQKDKFETNQKVSLDTLKNRL